MFKFFSGSELSHVHSSAQSLSEENTLIPMNNEFRNENKSGYLNSILSRHPYIASFHKGHLVDNTGTPVGKGRFLYVLDPDNNLYLVPSNLNWNHSFILAGGPVKAAGFIETNNESLVELISNESGHYTPTFLEIHAALRFFNEKTYNSIIYESHDEAKSGIIKTFYLSDVAILSLNKLRKLPTLVIDTYTKKVTYSSQPISGYEDSSFRLEGIPNKDRSSISRYGLAPSSSLIKACT